MVTIRGNNKIASMTGGVFFTTTTSDRSTTGSNKLLTSPASILAYYIINNLLKMTDRDDREDWPLYTSFLPDGDNVKSNSGAVYDTTGIKDGRLMTGEVPQHPGTQLKIRSKSYEVGYIKIEDIASALEEVVGETIVMDTGIYLLSNISRTSPVISLGLDGSDKRRFLFTVNFLMTVKNIS